MLHSIFKRAVRDQLIVANPCEHTELPKVIARKSRTLTPTEYDLLIGAIPDRHRLLVETAIETGMRWGELIALRPRHIDFLRKSVTVEETIIEVSKKHSPTGERYVAKPYPKDNEPRTFGVDDDWLDAAARAHQDPRHRPRPAASSPPAPAPRSPATPSAPGSGSPPSKPAASTSPSACTTSATPTPPGSSPKDPTCAASWNAWDTPRSKPPRNTCTRSPKPTRRTSTPSPAPAADDNSPTEDTATAPSAHQGGQACTTQKTKH